MLLLTVLMGLLVGAEGFVANVNVVATTQLTTVHATHLSSAEKERKLRRGNLLGALYLFLGAVLGIVPAGVAGVQGMTRKRRSSSSG